MLGGLLPTGREAPHQHSSSSITAKSNTQETTQMSSTVGLRLTTPSKRGKMPSDQSVNLNHLLSFTLPPRQTPLPQSLPRRSRKTGTLHGIWNKERFVNAQYRFVMNPEGDYTVHFADPDIFFQWQDILQIIIPRSSALASVATNGQSNGQEEGQTSCPICLAPPTAPRMTKCGHVYCFPCILHYLNTSDNKWARCPICFDSVNEKQLKSVKWYDEPVSADVSLENNQVASSSISSTEDSAFPSTPRQGSMMRMRLMQRPRITTLALPRSHSWPSDLLPPHQAPFHFLPDVYSFAKFMLATPAYLIEDLTKDLDELSAERHTLSSIGDELGICFVDAAEQKLRHQMTKVAALETPQLRDAVERSLREQHEIEERVARIRSHRKEGEGTNSTNECVPHEFLHNRTSGYTGPTEETNFKANAATSNPNITGRNTPRPRRNLNPPPPSTSTYYFYQAASGLPIFLHPLDIKILLSHFHDYASFPDSITFRVESLTEGTVNDDLRKRCKYLAHMPDSADVVFVEADLESVVGAEGLKNFEGALRMRKTRRKEKERKDDRARAKAELRDKEPLVAPGTESRALALPLTVEVLDDPAEEAHASLDLPQVAGAWGARSFASALHSTAPGARVSARPTRREEEDEWDIDVAWHELEQRSGNTGGRRKKSNKLVVLGGGGGRRR